MENQDIHVAILSIMESMSRQGTSPGRLKNFENSYNVFEHYLSDNGIDKIDENICLCSNVNLKVDHCDNHKIDHPEAVFKVV